MAIACHANPNGRYHFLPAIDPYSSGVVADSGWEIVHVTLERPLPWRPGLDSVRRYLEGINRSRHCLCGVELRCPEPHSMDSFLAFNQKYHAVLDEWDMLVDGMNPLARTNVSPVEQAPSDSVLFGFSYTEPSETRRSTFVVAGGGELRDGGLEESRIVRLGETCDEAMIEKAKCVANIMNERLLGLGVDNSLLTMIDVYCAHPIDRILAEVVTPTLPAAARLGVRWFYTRPPVRDIEFEMDMRGVVRELVVDLR